LAPSGTLTGQSPCPTWFQNTETEYSEPRILRQNVSVESGTEQMSRVGARLGARTRTPNIWSAKSCTEMWVLSQDPRKSRVGARLRARLIARTRTPNTQSAESCIEMWVLSRDPSKRQSRCPTRHQKYRHQVGAPNQRTESAHRNVGAESGTER